MTTTAGQDRMDWNASLSLPPSPTSSRSARRLLELAAAEWELPALDSAELLLTELVTNAAVHARTDMIVRVCVLQRRLRVEVSDCSTVPPRPQRPTANSEHGRGLLLLQRLSSDWGWQEDRTGFTCKTVWFELDETSAPTTSEFDLNSVDAL